MITLWSASNQPSHSGQSCLFFGNRKHLRRLTAGWQKASKQSRFRLLSATTRKAICTRVQCRAPAASQTSRIAGRVRPQGKRVPKFNGNPQATERSDARAGVAVPGVSLARSLPAGEFCELLRVRRHIGVARHAVWQIRAGCLFHGQRPEAAAQSGWVRPHGSA